jgi:hypothetical protein
MAQSLCQRRLRLHAMLSCHPGRWVEFPSATYAGASIYTRDNPERNRKPPAAPAEFGPICTSSWTSAMGRQVAPSLDPTPLYVDKSAIV